MAADEGMSVPSRFDDALVTDRPDAAEASVTVGKGRFQIETGVGYTHDERGGTTTKTFGMPTLLRYGIVDPVELRVEGEIFNVQSTTGAALQRGFTDMAVGAKVHVTDGGGLVPSFGVLGHLSTPTGNETFSSNGWEPTMKLLADWELPGKFGLGTNAGFDVPVRDAAGHKFVRFLYAAALSRGIPGLEDRLRVFIESAGAISLKRRKAHQHQFDTGLTVLLTPDMQLDVAAQIGLAEDSPDLAMGLGFSWRL
ncbi:MAG: transporter [Polyangiaceae bacterium]